MDIQALHNTFEYCDGRLLRKNNTRFPVAGTKDKDGYTRVKIGYDNYFAHRIIFAMFHGYWPETVDHIDGNPSNNRIENLRAATQAENHRNKKKHGNSTSIYKGVSWSIPYNKWISQIYSNKVNYFLGTFDTEIEAAREYDKQAKILFQDFARVNGV